jgi:lipoate-protein ligase A
LSGPGSGKPGCRGSQGGQCGDLPSPEERPEPLEPLVNDDLLEEYARRGEPVLRLYEPQTVMVVMGAGRKAAEDVLEEQAGADGVPLLRRRGGGGTVVLSPGQAVLALVTQVSSPFRNREYFRVINGWVREALADLGVEPARVEDRGISDLAIGERKILGTSLYRRRLLLFYQGSLLVSNDLSLFDRYLRHPSRVPDYRGGRSHRDFCTTLTAEGCALSVPRVLGSLERVVRARLPPLR